jgi:hypothetical protein
MGENGFVGREFCFADGTAMKQLPGSGPAPNGASHAKISILSLQINMLQ